MIQLGFNSYPYYNYTLEINCVKFEHMDEAPARERAALARSAISMNMNGPMKYGPFLFRDWVRAYNVSFDYISELPNSASCAKASTLECLQFWTGTPSLLSCKWASMSSSLDSETLKTNYSPLPLPSVACIPSPKSGLITCLNPRTHSSSESTARTCTVSSRKR